MLKRIAERSRAIVAHNPAAARIVSAHAPGTRIEEIPHLFDPPPLPSPAEAIRFRQSVGIGSEQFLFGVFGYPLLGLAFSLLLLAGLSPGGLLARTRIPGAESIALWSYAIYLTHKQLCIILANKLAWNFDIGPHEPLGIALLIAASVAAGFVLYLIVETPFMKLRPARSALAAHLDHAERRLHVSEEGEEGAHAGRQLKVAGGRNRGAQAG